MWYFEAIFYNLDRGVEERITIEVDARGMHCTEHDAWCIAVYKALQHPMPLIFNGLHFLSC